MDKANAERGAELLDACRVGLKELRGQEDADQFDKMICAMADKLRRNADCSVEMFISIRWLDPPEEGLGPLGVVCCDNEDRDINGGCRSCGDPGL